MAHPIQREHIMRTLLYYEIFDHPLSEKELFYLLPVQAPGRPDLQAVLSGMLQDRQIQQNDSFYARPSSNGIAAVRLDREALARKRVRISRFMAHVIKRFPFVRAVMISGDLSKGVATRGSDIDFVIITEPRRLWICRSLLIGFKKVFLFNSRKYFCLNYFIDTDHLTLDDRNYYTATEIAHVMPLYNFALFLRYMNANAWIRDLFPNYRSLAFHSDTGNNRRSVLQRLLEWPMRGAWADRLDARLMEFMRATWKKRYPDYSDAMRDMNFRSTPGESRAYGGNFSDKILTMYEQKLREYHA